MKETSHTLQLLFFIFIFVFIFIFYLFSAFWVSALAAFYFTMHSATSVHLSVNFKLTIIN
jgi:hypothetical protein